MDFSFEGPFGTYDRGALQRGFQVYKEVCSACHSLNHIAFHNLDEAGGPGFHRGPGQGASRPATRSRPIPTTRARPPTTRAIRLTRAGTLADHFPPPFPNEQAARANNGGALPPDLSMIVKAREGGPQYVYSILTGFHQTPPQGLQGDAEQVLQSLFRGLEHLHAAAAGRQPVTYSDGTKATVDAGSP